MTQKIIFYDGLCPFCNFWVNKILKWDKEETFLFASLQGETAELFFKENSILVIPNSLIYWEENKSYALRSLAVFEIAKHLKGFVGLIVIFRFLPTFLTDGIYSFIANNRFLFGQPFDACPLPPLDLKHRFLV